MNRDFKNSDIGKKFEVIDSSNSNFHVGDIVTCTGSFSEHHKFWWLRGANNFSQVLNPEQVILYK